MSTLLLMLWGGLSALPPALALTWALAPGRVLLPEFLLAAALGAALAAGLWARARWAEAAPWRLVLEGWAWASLAAALAALALVAWFLATEAARAPTPPADALTTAGAAVLVALLVGWRYGVIPLLGPLWVWGLRWAAKNLGLR